MHSHRVYPQEGSRHKLALQSHMYEEAKKRNNNGSKEDFGNQPHHSASFQDYAHKEMSLQSADLMR